MITHAYQVAWLVRDAPRQRWLGLNCGNASLTVIQHRDRAAPTPLSFNDMGHLPPELRWTGSGETVRA